MRSRVTFRPLGALVALLMVSLFAAVGFRVGQIVRPSAADAAGTWQSARTASYARSRTTEYGEASRRAYAQGWRAGKAAAEVAGSRAGRLAGEVEASNRAAAARALTRALASSPRRLKRGARTQTCVPVAGGLCEVLGPRVTGKPCPPGSLPFQEGGAVCVPRLLLALARSGR